MASETGGDDLLDLDAQVLRAYWDAALDLVVSVAMSCGEGEPILRVADLGAGTGTGAVGLAARLPAAEVVALDLSQGSLARVAAHAAAAGVSDRVRSLVVDLDDGWPDLGVLDLTWASMSLHHLADPGASLEQLRRATRPGGLVAVAEFAEPVRFLPDDLGVGRPGLESRALEALKSVHEQDVPTIGSEWSAVLADAGWTVLAEQALTIHQGGTDHPLTGAYARAWFDRLRQGLAGRLDADDLSTLAVLLDDSSPHGLLHREDLRLHGTRTVTVARA
ncbi:MAG: class I SAM-dependent methyltransferase [Humibacillus sp.]